MAPITRRRAANKTKRVAGKTDAMNKKKDVKGKKNKNKKKKKAAPVLPVELPLPHDVCLEIAKHVHESEALAFAMTCRGFRDAMKEALKTRKNTVYTGKRRKMLLTTRTRHYGWSPYVFTINMEKGDPVSEDWIKWAFSMKWRYANERDDNEKKKGELLTYLASLGGFKDVLVWLRSEGCVLDPWACYGAARGGYIDMLKYLKSKGLAFDSWTCRVAALGGQIKVLKYLKSEGVPFDSETCQDAARGGHIDVLKYLKSEGVAFDSMTCREAAWAGQLEVLKWLRSEEVNCPWDIQDCLREAKRVKRKEVVTWIESFL